MEIDIASANVVEVYQALVGMVTPRPIAWVTTLNPAGQVNLAPFSFFNVFGANPPIVVFSPTLRRDGTKKDTLLNLERTREFVLNIANERLAEAVNGSSKELPADESELEFVKLTARPSSTIKTPGVAESPGQLECVVDRILPFGHGPISANLVIGRVTWLRIDDRVLGADGRPDPLRLRAIGRLGGDDFCRTTDVFSMTRP